MMVQIVWALLLASCMTSNRFKPRPPVNSFCKLVTKSPALAITTAAVSATSAWYLYKDSLDVGKEMVDQNQGYYEIVDDHPVFIRNKRKPLEDEQSDSSDGVKHGIISNSR